MHSVCVFRCVAYVLMVFSDCITGGILQLIKKVKRFFFHSILKHFVPTLRLRTAPAARDWNNIIILRSIPMRSEAHEIDPGSIWARKEVRDPTCVLYILMLKPSDNPIPAGLCCSSHPRRSASRALLASATSGHFRYDWVRSCSWIRFWPNAMCLAVSCRRNKAQLSYTV